MARTFKVEGTKDFLIWAAVLFMVGLWAIKDGWFPSATVLERHPLEIVLSAEAESQVFSLSVNVGQMVAENEVLGELHALADGKAQRLRAPAKGQVMEISARQGETVSAGQPVCRIDPKDHFYLFNKSLTLLSMLGALICLWIHFVVQ